MCQKESGFIIRLTDALERRSKCILLKFSFCFPYQKPPHFRRSLQLLRCSDDIIRGEHIYDNAGATWVYRPSKRNHPPITNYNHLGIKSPNKKMINQASKFNHRSTRWNYRNLKCFAWVIFLEIFHAWVLLINSLSLTS